MPGYPEIEQDQVAPRKGSLQDRSLRHGAAPVLCRTETRVIEERAHKKSVKREYHQHWEEFCEWASLCGEDLSDAGRLDDTVCKFLRQACLDKKPAQFAESTIVAAKFYMPAGRTGLWRARFALEHWGEPLCSFWLNDALERISAQAFAITDVQEKMLYSSCFITATRLRCTCTQVRHAADAVMKPWMAALADFRAKMEEGCALGHPCIQIVVQNSPGLLGLEAAGNVQEKSCNSYNYGGAYSWLCMRGRTLGVFFQNTLAWHYFQPDPPSANRHIVGLDRLTEHVQEGVNVVVESDIRVECGLIRKGTKGVVAELKWTGDAMVRFDSVKNTQLIRRSQFSQLMCGAWDRSGLGRQTGAYRCEVRPDVLQVATRLKELHDPALESDAWRLLNPSILRTLAELFPDAKYDVALFQHQFAKYDNEAPYAQNIHNGSYDFAIQGQPEDCYVAAGVEIVDWDAWPTPRDFNAFPMRNNGLTMLRTQDYLSEETVESYCELLRSATSSGSSGRPTVLAFDFFTEGTVNREQEEYDEDGNKSVLSRAPPGKPVPQIRSIDVRSTLYPRDAKLFVIDGHHKLEASVRVGCSINVLVFAAAAMPYSTLTNEEGNRFTRSVSFPALALAGPEEKLKANWPAAEKCLHCTWQLSSSHSPVVVRFVSYGCGCHEDVSGFPKWAYAAVAYQTKMHNAGFMQAKTTVLEKLKALPVDHPLLNEHFSLSFFELSEECRNEVSTLGFQC